MKPWNYLVVQKNNRQNKNSENEPSPEVHEVVLV